MVVYAMKHKVGIKIAFDVINPWSTLDRNTPVSFRGKNVCICEETGVPAPLRLTLVMLCIEVLCYI